LTNILLQFRNYNGQKLSTLAESLLDVNNLWQSIFNHFCSTTANLCHVGWS